MSTSKPTPGTRLQRFELVGIGGYSEHRQLEMVESYPGQVPDERDEWCNAEDVAPLEDANTALLAALEEIEAGGCVARKPCPDEMPDGKGWCWSCIARAALTTVRGEEASP